MPVTASAVFEFLDLVAGLSIARHEVSASYFGILRKSVRSIASRLSDANDDEGRELCDQLRVIVSEWLTVPLQFDASMAASLQFLGDPTAVEARWGREVRSDYETALAAAEIATLDGNPVRDQIRSVIEGLRAEGHAFRIYCHKAARGQFESVFSAPVDTPLSSEFFLHSVVDYREAPPFDVLIKVGPLRSRGWGAAPDALLTAPRFRQLVQIVWIGCADEEDFGYDPASPETAAAEGDKSPGTGGPPVWTRSVITVGDDTADSSGAGSVDDLTFFQRAADPGEMRRATLLQIDDSHGIMYPPHSNVASFDPIAHGHASIGYRIPGDSLTEGMFVLWAVLGDTDLGGVQAGDGYYSRIWKEHLRVELQRNPTALLARLSAAGIELQHLRSGVRSWCRPPSTVIHAPKQRRHFESLIRVLGIEHDSTATAQVRRRSWWEYAWNEIGRSRGEAIQTGMQEHEIVDEQLFARLRDMLPDIRNGAAARETFEIEIPSGRGLAGAVRFYPVISIEDGFFIPATALKSLCDLDTIQPWRI
jgi:hypothetical protein